MANESTDKALIASSEFDPANFIKGIDAMTASLEKLSTQEDQIKGDLKNINTALASNRAEMKQNTDQIAALDKASKTYTDDLAKLTKQQADLKTQNQALRETYNQQKTALNDVDAAAKKYKDAITGLNAISKQVAQENKGRTLFDVASLNAQVQEVTQLGGKLRNVFQGKISTAELDKFEASLASTNDEFQQLGQIITFVKGKLDTLDPNSQEFADLTKIIQTGDQVLEEYNKTLENTDKASGSLKGRLAAMRAELVALEEQGKDNTKEFQDLQIAAGKLQDQIGDAQARIKVLSSDTRNLDFGIQAIRGVASAFGVAEGAAALFGIKNEDVMESIQRLNSIMLILNGLQEIQNILQKESVLRIVGAEIATKAAAVAQRIYAVAVGTSTGAMKLFRTALLATGIGAFVVLLGLAADAMGLFGSSTEDATDDSKAFNESLEDSILLLASRTRFIKLNTSITEEELKRQGATEQQLSDNRIKGLQKERAELVKTKNEIRGNQDAFLDAGKSGGDYIEKSNAEVTQIVNRILDIDDTILLEKQKNLTRAYEDQKKSLEKQLQLYQAYLDRLAALQRELRDKLLAAQPQDEAAIRQSFKNSLTDAIEDLDKEVERGKLTKARATMLKNIVNQINDVDVSVAVADFKKESLKAENDLSKSIFELRMRNGMERAELLRDQFVREAAIVRIEANKAKGDLERERDDLIQGVNDAKDQGLISPAAAAENIEKIKTLYAQLLENLAAQTTRKQEEITARTFEKTQTDLQTIFANVQLFVSEAATVEIQKATKRFLDGKISYEQYQKELTRIAKDESDKRIATALRENKALLAGVQERLKAEQDPERKKALEDRERQLRKTISDLEREQASADAEGEQSADTERDARLQKLATYASAIGGIVQQVVAFWQQANQAEQEALERSISLQEKRVDAATRIAERGNAEYLRLEEDRLNELQVKQENAARRQLAINAVIQTSQALTAFVTALAQGIATGGPLGGIAIAGAVIGLIASGYAIITSLQKNNSQGLYKGTKSVKRNGEPSGVDTIPAMLTENEAVIPADTNKQYAPAVAAIYDKTVPAEDMNAFVNSYRVNNRSLPRLDHDRMGDVAGVVVTYNGQLLEATQDQNRKLEENNQLLRNVDHRLKTMGITATVDKNGLAISLMKATDQFKIDKNS